MLDVDVERTAAEFAETVAALAALLGNKSQALPAGGSLSTHDADTARLSSSSSSYCLVDESGDDLLPKAKAKVKAKAKAQAKAGRR